MGWSAKAVNCTSNRIQAGDQLDTHSGVSCMCQKDESATDGSSPLS